MSCTKKGEDMSITTFRNALKYDGMLTIGGGEPTLHPLFWQILMEAIAHSEESLWMATNGSQTEIALALANLAKKGVLGVALSLDVFHDPIDCKVVEAFTKSLNHPSSYNTSTDYREIRNVSGHLIKAGRCKDGEEGCICSSLFVKPNGDVKGCGCKNAPLFGNVNKGFEIPYMFEDGECTIDRRKNKKIAA